MNHQAATGSDNLAAARRRVLPATLLIALTLLAYFPAMRGGFLWDDDLLIAENPLVTEPGGLSKTWLTKEEAEYLPLTFTMHWAEWRLWNGRPAGFHVVNVLLHAASAVLLWRVLGRLRVPGAWLAGVLFAVHPVAVASAAWISELKNMLSMMLYLLSLLAYLRYDDREELGRRSLLPAAALGRQSPWPPKPWRGWLGDGGSAESSDEGRWRWYALAIFLFLLALLAKTSVVMLPVVLLLCAWWRRGRISRRDLLRSVPFFALSLALGLVTIWFQWRGWRAPGAEEFVRPEGLASRVAAAGWIPWFYLFKLLLPAGLCVIYPRWNVDGSSALAFLPLLLLLGGMAFLWTRRKSWGRAPLFAAAYFLIMLLPVLGFVEMSFMTYSFVADHLQYAAMIGVIAFAAGLFARACPEPIRGAAAASGRAGRAGFLAAAACVALLAVLTWDRASLYADGKLLWRENIARNPTTWAVWSGLGNACFAAGLHEEAIRSLDRAVALRPDFAVLYFFRGGAHAAANQFAEAMKDYDKAIALRHDFAAAYNNRSGVYAINGRYDEAIRDCDRAIKLKPDYAEAYSNRGNIYAQINRPADAIQDYDKAIALKREFAEAYFNRSVACGRLGKFDEAVRGYSTAIGLKPDFFQAYNNRGKIFADASRLSEAIRDYEKAIALNPRYAEALYNHGNACAEADRLSEAIQDYDQAIALKPDYREAYNNRAVARYRTKEYDRALADVKLFQRLGGHPNPDFLKALSEAAGRRK